jgi:hypothetical protein
MRSMPARGRLALALAAGMLTGAGCTAGGDDSAAPSAPRSSPSRAAPTPDEVELAMGEPASFTLPGDSGRSSRVRLAVTDVTEGRISDLSKFRLDAQARASTPYYATVRVTNRGEGRLAGTRLTLWALGSDGTVRPPADVVGSFRRCQDSPLPDRFARGDSARTCLLYLLPEGTTLQAVQYRFNDRPPYSWPVE